jgi:tetratricopeptide (TPR) repeat protein
MAGAFLLGVVLPILPIVARNYVISDGLVPISGTGGINFYTGNNPESDGYSPIPSGIGWERTWYAALAHGAMGGRAQDAYWRTQALRFWGDHPKKALSLLAKKAYLYWGAYEIPNNVSYDWGRAHASVLRIAPFTFAVIGPLALVGIALGGWRSRGAWALALFVATQMVAVVIFFVCGRYRMPALPVLCVFAGVTVVGLVRSVGKRHWGRLGLGLGMVVVFALFINSDLYGVAQIRGANRDSYYLGQAYVLAQDYERATDAFRRATEQNPDDADAYALLGQVEMEIGEPEAAARDLVKALDIAPDFSTAAARLAGLCLEQGWPLDEPERLLRRALDYQTMNVAGLATLARVNIRQGKLQDARANLGLALVKLSKRGGADTRSAAARAELLRAWAEAKAAGVELPEGY